MRDTSRVGLRGQVNTKHGESNGQENEQINENCVYTYIYIHGFWKDPNLEVYLRYPISHVIQGI